MNCKSITQLLVASLLYFTVTNAHSTMILNIDSGTTLVGVQNLNVNGTLYNVEFIRGTCFDVFGTCDGSATFVFSNEASALLAGQALLDQVFLDLVTGENFDTEPDIYFAQGCGNYWLCESIIPYGANTSHVQGVVVINARPGWAGSAGPDGTGLDSVSNVGTSLVTGLETSYARFTLVEVSSPSVFILLLLAMSTIMLRQKGRS